ncbi:unnamed protein product [Didymodactylos carnosus]|uniref:Uncharacterized protein n=1 Tax=Didymodactylos carnosus TaxID=1234261 RepID=A0A815VRM8_9BILA|nr:unnamed protein product [Didymodactylos carnosus]CAF1631112.1 unnamed protein product [Didymodactylos carnosus]CAF4398714.1 unnamed protein product [Didymodactylos carnosus]CAF4457477.1 unnamed protein product [Didymodactylos carnosus]
MINLINNPSLNESIIQVFEKLIQYKKEFSNETFHILINFASENKHQILRDKVIDGLELITKYETILLNILILIRFEIVSKKLRNSKLKIIDKITIIDQCVSVV